MRWLLLFLVMLPLASPAVAQDSSAGHVGTSAVGEAGRRLTREPATRGAGISPMVRLNSRVVNRVQSRIRNRIDRFYIPQGNAMSPFAAADEQARTPGRSRER